MAYDPTIAFALCCICGVNRIDDGQGMCLECWRSLKDQWVTHDKICRDLHDGDIWWHDNGESIYPVNLMWCPTGQYFFAPAGQWGWGRSQPVGEMGGRWMPCVEPEPDTAFRATWGD